MNWEELSFKHVEKTWGSEDWLVNCDEYCAKILTINQYCGGSYHYHEDKDETFLCLSGEVQLLLEAGRGHTSMHKLRSGVSMRIPPQCSHLIIGISEEPCILLEVSTHHDDKDVVRHFRIDGVDPADYIERLREDE